MITKAEKRFNLLKQQYKDLTAPQILAYAAQTYDHQIALIINNKEYSYTALYQWSLAITDFLTTHVTLNNHHKIAFVLPNDPLWYALYYGILQTNSIVVPLSIFLTAPERTAILEHAQPELFIAPTAILNETAVPATTTTLAIEELPTLESIANQPLPKNTQLSTYTQKPCTILYTAGTTGLPKGVMLSSKAMITNALQAISIFDMHANDRLACFVPFFHSFSQNSCLWTAPLLGIPVITVPTITRTTIIQACAANPTIIIGVPALYKTLVLLHDYIKLNNVRLAVSGGDVLPKKLVDLLYQTFGIVLHNGYGLTEAAPFVSADLTNEPYLEGNVGNPMPGITCLIDKPDKNNIGQLMLSGDNIMDGYYNDLPATQEVLYNNKLYTGDLAYIDQQNNIILVGRSKDLIIHKGINIYPAQIEQTIMQFPSIASTAVIGVEHERGQVPIAYLTLKNKTDNHETIMHELTIFLETQLAPYQLPNAYYILDDIPVTAMGKINKKLLQEQYLKNQ
jgi:long-chain acyl-CoA synthetase